MVRARVGVRVSFRVKVMVRVRLAQLAKCAAHLVKPNVPYINIDQMQTDHVWANY